MLILSHWFEAAQKRGCGLQCGHARQLGKLEGTWADLKASYGLKHQDTDMSSAARDLEIWSREKKLQWRRYRWCWFRLCMLRWRKRNTAIQANHLEWHSWPGRKIKMVTGLWLIRALSRSSQTTTLLKMHQNLGQPTWRRLRNRLWRRRSSASKQRDSRGGIC